MFYKIVIYMQYFNCNNFQIPNVLRWILWGVMRCMPKMSQKWNWNIFKLQLSINLKAELWAFQYSNIQNVILQYCHFTLLLITLQLFTEIYCVSSLGDFSQLPPSQEGKAQKDSSSLHPVSHPPETPKVPQKFPYFRMNHERLLTTLSNWKFSDVAWRLCHLSTPPSSSTAHPHGSK